MAKVWFRNECRTHDMFKLNSCKQLDIIPCVGDVIKVDKNDFMKLSFRMKPNGYSFHDFKVIERRYSLVFDEWELICEPTVDTLMYAMKNISVK